MQTAGFVIMTLMILTVGFGGVWYLQYADLDILKKEHVRLQTQNETLSANAKIVKKTLLNATAKLGETQLTALGMEILINVLEASGVNSEEEKRIAELREDLASKSLRLSAE